MKYNFSNIKLVARHSHEWSKSAAQPCESGAVAYRSQRDCEAYQKSLHNPRPRIFGCNLYKTSNTWKTNVQRLYVGLAIDTDFWSFSGRQEVLYGMWPGL